MTDFNKKLFEKIFIYNCITDESYFESVVEYTKPSFFENENIRSVFTDLMSFYGEYKKLPNKTELNVHITKEENRKALKNVLLSFSDIDKNYNKDVLIKLTENFLKEKTVLKTVQQTSIDIQSGEIDTSKILKNFEKACSICLYDDIGFDYLESIDQHCKDLQKTFSTLSSGWSWLDDKLSGGFQEKGKAMYVFFGQTNVGKSIFLGNIATNILSQNKTVLLITLEMPEEVYAKRISSQLSKISFSELKDKIEPLKKSLNVYKSKNSDAKLIIKEFPPKSISPIHLKTYIRKLIRNNIKPDIIILDYLSLLAPIHTGKDSYTSQKEIAEAVRAISYEFECSIVTAVQMNRSGYNQANPDLETTGESMGIAHTVDAQISIWTEEDDIDQGIIHMGIVKNRFGPRQCSTVLEIDYPTLSLKDPDNVAKDNITPIPDFLNTKKSKDDKVINSDIMSTLDLISKIGEDE